MGKKGLILKKIIVFLVFIIVLFSACSDDTVYDGHLDVFVGKVIERVDKNILLLQITEERGGYKVDDKVYVQYDEAQTYYESDVLEPVDPDYAPVIGDECAVQADPYYIEKKDGYDLRRAIGDIDIYLNDSSNN